MELRAYWNIVWRWWWLVLGLAAIVAVVSTLLQPQTRETWSSTVRIIARPQVEMPRGFGNYPPNQDRYYSVLNMELFWDDMLDDIRTADFAEEVRREALTNAGGRSVTGTFDGKKQHQSVAVTATADSPEAAQLLANTAARVLTRDDRYAQKLSNTGVERLIPSGSASPPFVSSRIGGTLNLGLRVLLGLIAGVALAFLMDYLDQSVRSAREAEETLQLPVLGEIPRPS